MLNFHFGLWWIKWYWNCSLTKNNSKPGQISGKTFFRNCTIAVVWCLKDRKHNSFLPWGSFLTTRKCGTWEENKDLSGPRRQSTLRLLRWLECTCHGTAKRKQYRGVPRYLYAEYPGVLVWGLDGHKQHKAPRV